MGNPIQPIIELTEKQEKTIKKYKRAIQPKKRRLPRRRNRRYRRRKKKNVMAEKITKMVVQFDSKKTKEVFDYVMVIHQEDVRGTNSGKNNNS